MIAFVVASATAKTAHALGPEPPLPAPSANVQGTAVAPPSPSPDAEPKPLSLEQVRAQLAEVRLLTASDRWQEAATQLLALERGAPTLADRIAIERGDALMRSRQPQLACIAYATAAQSPDSSIATRARVGAVRCLLEGRNRLAEPALTKLLNRFPEAPEALSLRLELARARESWGNLKGAAAIYRDIDLGSPGTPEAEVARRRIALLQLQSVPVRAYTMAEKLERADMLVRWGPLDHARRTLDELAREPHASKAVLQRVALLSTRLQRPVERPASIAATTAGPAPDSPTSSGADPEALAKTRMKAITRGVPVKRLAPARMMLALRTAASEGLTLGVDEILDAAQKSKRLNPRFRFELAMAAAGVASDERLIAALDALVDAPKIGVSARYHRARALERLQKWNDAGTEYARVRSDDHSEGRYYGMWAELRMTAIDQRQQLSCAPAAHDEASRENCLVSRGLVGRGTTSHFVMAASSGSTANSTVARRGTLAEDAARVAENLRKISERYGQVYPWFSRAADLIELGDLDAAGDELYEAYLAYRAARGRNPPRAGIEAVYSGKAVLRKTLDRKTRRARLTLDAPARAVLADAAKFVGDVGTAILFGGQSVVNGMPKAYESVVQEAAERHRIDPNLLFAVMRVESVYQRRIVSYVGAIGLMQIMPRTGRLIAFQMGYDRFNNAQLLNASTNIGLSAWYLASLLKRFDGRLPLAIAAYNGGPHNVRKWLAQVNPKAPLDAFLEQIPFGETHRYVRRVLTNYAAYKRQAGEAVPVFDVSLPPLRPDPVVF